MSASAVEQFEADCQAVSEMSRKVQLKESLLWALVRLEEAAQAIRNEGDEDFLLFMERFARVVDGLDVQAKAELQRVGFSTEVGQ